MAFQKDTVAHLDCIRLVSLLVVLHRVHPHTVGRDASRRAILTALLAIA